MNNSTLKLSPYAFTSWFSSNSLQMDFYYLTLANNLIYFEIHLDGKLLCGGRKRPLSIASLEADQRINHFQNAQYIKGKKISIDDIKKMKLAEIFADVPLFCEGIHPSVPGAIKSYLQNPEDFNLRVTPITGKKHFWSLKSYFDRRIPNSFKMKNYFVQAFLITFITLSWIGLMILGFYLYTKA